MNNQFAEKLEQRLLPIRKSVETLEQASSVRGSEKIAAYSAKEDDIIHQLEALANLGTQAGSVFVRLMSKKLQSLAARMDCLPTVPRIEVVHLAQNILAQNPVVLVTDDAFHEKRQRPELTRIFLLETKETSCFDYQFPSFSSEN